MRGIWMLTALALCAAGCGGSDDVATGDDQALTATQTWSGLYRNFDSPTTGTITQLNLKANHWFYMEVQGLYGCSGYKGYDCPWSLDAGYWGWTTVVGTWSAQTTGVTLHPTGQGTKDSAPVVLALELDAGKLVATGKIVSRSIKGSLDVEARYGLPHKLVDTQLNGTWKVTTPLNSQGQQATLKGDEMLVKGDVHTVMFDTTKHTYDEHRSGSTTVDDGGTFLVAATPDGTGFGVIVLDDGSPTYAVTVTGLSGNVLQLAVPENRTMRLQLQP